jgi:predicted DNA-binding protein (MmcQ/YjbR family)
MSAEILEKLRAICLVLPESREGQGVGNPSFRVRDKIFAMQHSHQDRPSLWCKAPQGLQAALVQSQADNFFVPPYVGQHGWIGIWLDIEQDWDEISEFIEESYCMTAPKKLVKQLKA